MRPTKLTSFMIPCTTLEIDRSTLGLSGRYPKPNDRRPHRSDSVCDARGAIKSCEGSARGRRGGEGEATVFTGDSSALFAGDRCASMDALKDVSPGRCRPGLSDSRPDAAARSLPGDSESRAFCAAAAASPVLRAAALAATARRRVSLSSFSFWSKDERTSATETAPLPLPSLSFVFFFETAAAGAVTTGTRLADARVFLTGKSPKSEEESTKRPREAAAAAVVVFFRAPRTTGSSESLGGAAAASMAAAALAASSSSCCLRPFSRSARFSRLARSRISASACSSCVGVLRA